MKKMFNKLKWTIKKIVLFLFHPLVTIKHNFDFEYISTLLNNQNIIKANRGKYNNLDDSIVSDHNFDIENISLSKLLAIWISILGEIVSETFSTSYVPLDIALCKISFWFVATTNLLIGRPIFFAR